MKTAQTFLSEIEKSSKTVVPEPAPVKKNIKEAANPVKPKAPSRPNKIQETSLPPAITVKPIKSTIPVVTVPKVITAKTAQNDKAELFAKILDTHQQGIEKAMEVAIDKQGDKFEKALTLQHQVNVAMMQNIHNTIEAKSNRGMKIDVVRDENGFAQHYIAYPVEISPHAV